MSNRPRRVSQRPARPVERPWFSGLPRAVITAGAALILVIAGGLAYHNSLHGPFIFDDIDGISGSELTERAWPPWALVGETTRPVPTWSFALNRAAGGLDVWGYHVTNLAIHLAAGLALFGLVRRTLTGLGEEKGDSPHLPERPEGGHHARMVVAQMATVPFFRYGKVATWLALAVALLWMLHPLQTQAVTYIVQRMESLMGLLYLLTLYCFARAADSRQGSRRQTAESSRRQTAAVWWYAASITCCALGMGTKEVMVTAPVMVLWYDRVFVAASWKEIFQRRWPYYAALAGTWGVLAGLIWRLKEGYGSGGDALIVEGLTPLRYLISQPGVILHYLRLTFWPDGLCLDYGPWKVAETAGEILPPLLVIAGLGLVTVWCMFRRPAWGFVGGWFFVILSPSSSIVPIKDLAFEHRMYLSLAAVIVVVVLGGYGLGNAVARRWGNGDSRRLVLLRAVSLLAVAGVAAGLGGRTWRRNEDYSNALSMWDNTIAQRPENSRAYNNRGNVYARMAEKAVGPDVLNKLHQAVADYTKAIELEPRYALAYNNRSALCESLGTYDQGIADASRALELEPKYVNAYYNRGNNYQRSGRIAEAIADYTRAIELSPEYAEAYNNRGAMYMKFKDYERAGEDFALAIELKPEIAKAWQNRGDCRWNQQRFEEALADFTEAIELDPDSPPLLNKRGNANSQLGRYHEAMQDYSKAIRLDPTLAEAYHNRAVAHYFLRSYGQAWADIRACRQLGGTVQPNFIELLTKASGRSG